jgi:hypothetical protein
MESQRYRGLTRILRPKGPVHGNIKINSWISSKFSQNPQESVKLNSNRLRLVGFSTSDAPHLIHSRFARHLHGGRIGAEVRGICALSFTSKFRLQDQSPPLLLSETQSPRLWPKHRELRNNATISCTLVSMRQLVVVLYFQGVNLWLLFSFSVSTCSCTLVSRRQLVVVIWFQCVNLWLLFSFKVSTCGCYLVSVYQLVVVL